MPDDDLARRERAAFEASPSTRPLLVCADELVPLAEQMRERAQRAAERGASAAVLPETVEFECRMGTVNADGAFVSGVPHHVYEDVMHHIQGSRVWSRTEDYVETYDYYHHDLNGRLVRTTTAPSTSSGAGAGGAGAGGGRGSGGEKRALKPHHTLKEKLASRTFVLADAHATRADGDVTGAGLDLRFSLSVEHEISRSVLPALVKPRLVRIKQRRRFWLNDVFRFDFSIVFSGTTRDEAERVMHRGPLMTAEPGRRVGSLHYEIELEIEQPLRAAQENTSLRLALSMLMKMRDFVARAHHRPPTWVPYARGRKRRERDEAERPAHRRALAAPV